MLRSFVFSLGLIVAVLIVDGRIQTAGAADDVCATGADEEQVGSNNEIRWNFIIADPLDEDGACETRLNTSSQVNGTALSNQYIAVNLNTFDADVANNATGINIRIGDDYNIDSLTTTVNGLPDNTAKNGESFFYSSVEFDDAFKSVIQVTRTTDSKTFNFTVEKAANTHVLNTVTFSSGPLPVVPASAGGNVSDSEKLADLQRRLSGLNVQSGSNTLGDNIFDHLDNIFGAGDSGPVITPTGFSASTRGVANWIGGKQRQKLENRLADMPAHEDGTKVAITPVAALMPVQKPKWNAWIKGNYRFYDGDGSSFDGHTIDVLAGLDYRVADAVVMGLVGGYGITDFDTLTGGTSGAFSADGYTAGAYVGIRLGSNAQFDTLAAYTYSDYENRVGAVSGDFTAHRVTVAARLKGTWESEGGVFFEPGVRILYAEEWQGAYTDSAGVRQSSLTVTAGRVSVGPKVGYVHRSEDGATVKTWIAAYGEYDFSNQGNAPTSGLPDFDDILSGRVSAGVSAHSPGGVGLSLEGDIGGLGSGEYTSYGGTARIDLPI